MCCFNMLVVFFFGPPLEGRWGSSEFIRYYLVCGFGGVLLAFLLAPSAPIVGASAACYGLMLAFAMNWPDAPIYVWGIFPVQAKWLVGFLFVITLLNAFGAPGGPVAHMGPSGRHRSRPHLSEGGLASPRKAGSAPSTDGTCASACYRTAGRRCTAGRSAIRRLAQRRRGRANGCSGPGVGQDIRRGHHCSHRQGAASARRGLAPKPGSGLSWETLRPLVAYTQNSTPGCA